MLNKVGRDEISVRKKGEVEIKEFGDYAPLPRHLKDPLGPGVYNIEKAKPNLGDEGVHVKGAVRMDRLVARADAVGPNGEVPESAQIALHEIADDDELMLEMLEMDYGMAKDKYLDMKQEGKKNKNLVLYRKDRHEERDKKYKALAEDPLNEHLGGSFYEDKGLSEELKRRPKNQGRFDIAPGRAGGGDNAGRKKVKSEEDKLMEEMLAEVDGVEALHANHPAVEGEALDVDLGDQDNLRLPKPVFLAKFPNPETRPRFEEKNSHDESANVDYDVQYDAVRETPGPYLVNYDQQVGRREDRGRGGISENASAEDRDAQRYIQEELGEAWGEPSNMMARSLEKEREIRARLLRSSPTPS